MYFSVIKFIHTFSTAFQQKYRVIHRTKRTKIRRIPLSTAVINIFTGPIITTTNIIYNNKPPVAPLTGFLPPSGKNARNFIKKRL